MSRQPVTPATDQALAVTAQALYLSNLLLLPGLAFFALLGLYWRYRERVSPWALCHLLEALSASVWAGLLIILVNALILMIGGYQAANTWLVLVLYFTIIHSSLVLLGIVALSKAMSGQRFHYPFIGISHCGE